MSDVVEPDEEEAAQLIFQTSKKDTFLRKDLDTQ